MAPGNRASGLTFSGGLDRRSGAFLEAADGIRTHDLLHGKRLGMNRFNQEDSAV
jgi:hypothetical protein